MSTLTPEEIKEKAQELGADLVGICSAAPLNAYSPDPNWPQTPQRIWPGCQSAVAIIKRLPWGLFQAKDRLVRQAEPHPVLDKLDAIAVDLTYYIESRGFHACPVPGSHGDTELKRGTYGPLSLRHVAIEAGLGTLGLGLLLLTPQYGPRVYVAVVLTDAELSPDQRMRQRLCLGVSCSRCLLACPADAVEHWALNKRLCSSYAQQFGFAAFRNYLGSIFDAKTNDEKRELVLNFEVANFWQALRTGTGNNAGCHRCMEVCPVGEDYAQHLKQRHAKIAELNEAKRAKQQRMMEVERKGEPIPGWEASKRWICE